MHTAGHEKGCLQLGMREDVYSWHERMLTVGQERECLQLGMRECLQLGMRGCLHLGMRENAYSWA